MSTNAVPNEQSSANTSTEWRSLSLVRLFLVHGKHEIARRRLQNILAQFSQTQAAVEAGQMLQGL